MLPLSKWLTSLTESTRIRGEFLWVLLGQGAALLGGLATVKILSNLLGPEGYGFLGLGMAVAGFVVLMSYGPISQAITRFYSVFREKQGLADYFRIISRLHINIFLILLVVVGVGSLVTYAVFGFHWGTIIALGSLLGILMGLNTCLVSLHNAARLRKQAALYQSLATWLRLGFALAAILIFGLVAPVALAGFLAGAALVVLWQWFHTRAMPEFRSHLRKVGSMSSVSQGVPAPDGGIELREGSSEVLKYMTPFFLWSILGALSLYSDRWIIQATVDQAGVGIYFAFFQIANAPVLLIAGLVGQLSTPAVFDRAGSMSTEDQKNNSWSLVNKAFVLSALVFAGLTLLFFLFSEGIVRLATSEAFVAQHKVIWVLVAALSIQSLAQVLTGKGLSANKPSIYIWPKVAQSVSFLVASIPLGLSSGIFGVSLALCASSVIYLATVELANRRIRSSL